MKHLWKKTDWFWAALLFTAAYAIGIIVVLGWANIRSFMATTTDLNETGDFLAGVFAPLALIWLVAAVLTQRQELHETRAQFAKNQKVVDEQMKAIKQQTTLTSLQLSQTVENAEKAYKLTLFDKRFQIYEKFVKFGKEHETHEYDEDSYSAIINLSQEAAFVFDQSIEEWLSDIGQQIFDYLQFKRVNPLPMVDDGFGNKIAPSDDAETQKLKEEYRKFTAWIDEQFLPDERSERFWQFMNVSDVPYMSG